MQLGRWERWRWAAALGAGLVLRCGFLAVHARFVGDTLVYGDLAHNLLAHRVYGLTEDAHVRATLIRLPGYPLFLALCFLVFGTGKYLPVLWVQVVVDLLGCFLLGQVARRVFGARVGVVCVWMAALCPFTANYVAAALTETLSVACVVLGFWGLAGWMHAVRREEGSWGWAVAVGVALCGALLLRPDGVLLAAAVLPAMLWVAWRGWSDEQVSRQGNDRKRGESEKQVRCGNDNRKSQGEEQIPSGDDRKKGTSISAHAKGAEAAPSTPRSTWVGVGIACGLLVGCLGAWSLRNWRVYHVFQPLAPKYANDPGEPAPLAFARWYRTWGVGLGDTARVYWVYDGDMERMSDLPARAFDSPAQRAETAALYARYNAETSSTPAVEAGFARLAEERVRAHPVRFYVGLPLARLGDMWLRPRTELFRRHMPLDWWDVRARPKAAVFGWVYGGVNVVLLGCAVVGLWRWWRAGWGGYGVLAAVMVGFVLLRSGMLMTIDNSEPRYVLECYPVVILLAAVAVSGGQRRGLHVPSLK